MRRSRSTTIAALVGIDLIGYISVPCRIWMGGISCGAPSAGRRAHLLMGGCMTVLFQLVWTWHGFQFLPTVEHPVGKLCNLGMHSSLAAQNADKFAALFVIFPNESDVRRGSCGSW